MIRGKAGMNMKFDFRKGVNVIKPLSNVDIPINQDLTNTYGNLEEPFNLQDIQLIQRWGLDHIRIMIMHSELMLDEEKPYVWNESGWEELMKTVLLCRDHGIGTILSLHSTPGYELHDDTFVGQGGAECNQLFKHKELIDKYCDIWAEFSRRMAGTEAHTVFEILNEPYIEATFKWNDIAMRAIQVIRSYSKERRIIYGGLHMNNIKSLNDLVVLKDDPNILYNFHFYAPGAFTHQRIPYDFKSGEFNRLTNMGPIHYPGRIPFAKEYVAMFPDADANYADYVENDQINYERLRDIEFAPLREFKEKHPQAQLICTEFGVTTMIPAEDRYNWQRDAVQLLKEYDVRMTYFAYKCQQWGIVDMFDRRKYDYRLVKLMTQ